MDLITTHANADFDALSALVAAKKLYPKARLLLPGSQEKSVRNFLSLIKDKIAIENEKTCKFDDVTKLIIVDTRHASRIGEAANIIKRKKVKVHIYDHHPPSESDIKADKIFYEEVGATVTMLLDILSKKGKLDLSPLEATLMLLGIYEETGFLSYRTTTKKDVEVVGKLLGMGANLAAASSYLNRELTGAELKVLIDLLESIKILNLSGIEIAFAKIDLPNFDGELGTVVHKLVEVENYPVIFAMFRHKDKVRIVARSRVESIDVNRIMGEFSGGGHSSAASAKVENLSFGDIQNKIIRALSKVVLPRIYAKDIMSSPVKTVSENEKVKDVWEKLESWGCKGAPCINEKGELSGIITEGDIKKAFKSNMEHSRAKGYMKIIVKTAKPDTPLHVLREIMQEEDKGRIPILDKHKLVGIVTRTDVLRQVHSSFFYDDKNLSKESLGFARMINRNLPKKLTMLIKKIGSIADHKGMNAFLVGGFVRDLLLGVKNFDLDIVVEGNAIDFGEYLSGKIGGSLVVHKKFGTCTIVQPWPSWLGEARHGDKKFKIDIATARIEKYERPAALPKVEFSSLKEDLSRRDFTINAMAVNINSRSFGFFIDFFGGKHDLKKKTIRVLHDKSFIDDPTRIFRAVRFEQRLKFEIEKHTAYLIQHAIKEEMFLRTEKQRIRDEVILILKENCPEKAVLRMKELHELRFIHPSLILPKEIERVSANIKTQVMWYETANVRRRILDVWLIYFMFMLDKLSFKETEEVLKNFVFTRSESIRVLSYKKNSSKVIRELASRKKVLPSRIFMLLEPLSHETALCMLSKSKSKLVHKRIRKFFTDYNGVTLKIKGHDLKNEGIEPGPKYKSIFDKVLCKKLDGNLKTKQEELEYLRKILGKN